MAKTSSKALLEFKAAQKLKRKLQALGNKLSSDLRKIRRK